MAQYKETKVNVNGEWKDIKSGDVVLLNGRKLMFDWCTHQFERWTDLTRTPEWPLGRQCNYEGGIGKVDAIVS